MSEHHHHLACGHEHEHIDLTGRAFAIGVILNFGFVIIETAFGLYSNSLSLLADAGHNFSDVLGLLAAWGAMLLARRLPTSRFTYGLRGSTILAALANAMLLLLAIGGIAWEAIRRFSNPAPINETVIIWVALIGFVINLGTALMLMRGREHDLNLKGAFLHMVADAAVSLGVAAAGIGMMLTEWQWLDPAISLLIAIVIFFGTWDLLKQSLRLSLHGVPEYIDPTEVRAFLASQQDVVEVHDLHIWGMSTTETALTAHLVVCGNHPGNTFLSELAEELDQRFRINHATFQIELAGSNPMCRLAPEHVV